MVASILNHTGASLKGKSTSKAAYESLYAKIQQARSLSDLLAHSDLSDEQTHWLTLAVAEILIDASKLIDTLPPDNAPKAA